MSTGSNSHQVGLSPSDSRVSARSTGQAMRAVRAAIIGNVLEWFDFATYAYLATAISKSMFPAGDEFVAMLGTFGAFGLGFAARPLGAIVFGWLGDKKGRKWTLAFVMPLMALGTILIALIPSYASIGILAPILLVLARLLQGFSVGGELGNAIAFLVEWAPKGRRGLYGSFQQCSTIGGMLLGSGAAALTSTLVSAPNMVVWGWRIPFIVGALVIGPLGWYIRHKSEESPVYETASNDGEHESAIRSPLIMALQACGLTIVWTVSLYIILSYLPSFIHKYVGMDAHSALWWNTGGLLLMTVSIPFWGALSDRVGRKPLIILGCLAFVILPYPVFAWMLATKSTTLVAAILLVSGVLIGIFSGVAPAALSEIFPTRIRTTWLSIGYGVANAIFGGFAPFIAISLIKLTGSPLSPAIYVIVAAVISTITVLTLKETAHKSLRS